MVSYEHKVKNIYLGNPERIPWDDVLLYLKLNSTTTNTDEIGTYTWTVQNVTYDSVGAYFNWNSRLYWNANLPDCTNVTIAFRWKFTYTSQNNDIWYIFFDGSNADAYDFCIGVRKNWKISLWKKRSSSEWESVITSTQTIDDTKYYCIVAVWDPNSISLYVNNQPAWSVSIAWNSNVWYHYYPCIWSLRDWKDTKYWYKWYLSNFVYSNKSWNQEERNDYYQWTKHIFDV